MTRHRRAGRTSGALMLAHLATGLIGPYVVLVPMTAPPGGFLANAVGMSGAIHLAIATLLVGALIPVLLTAIVWPRVREHAPATSLGLATLAGANLALQVVENGHWLTQLSVSQAYHAAGAAGADYAAVAVAVRAAFRWAHYGHIAILVGWILVWFLALERTRMLPRALAAVGIAAALVHLLGIPLPELLGVRLPMATLWGLPLAIGYALAALLLLARGFTDDARSTRAPGDSG